MARFLILSFVRTSFAQLIFWAVVYVVSFSSVYSAQVASAQDADTRVFSCNPVFIPIGVNNSFEIKRGKQISFACAIKNNDTTPLRIVLTGKQVKVDGTNTANIATLSATETVISGKRVVLPMKFPPVFEGGTFNFSFSLQNEATGKSIGSEVSFGSVLSAQEALINPAGANNSAVVSGGKITVTLPISLQNGTSTRQVFIFDVVLVDKDGKELAVIAKDQTISGDTDEYTFTLPEGSNYEGAFVRVFLKKINGELVDGKNFPLTILTKSGADKKSFAYILIPILLVAGYFIWRRNQSEKMTTENYSL